MKSYTYEDFEIIDAHSHIFPEKIVSKATAAIGDFYGLPMFGTGSGDNLIESGRKIGVKKYLVCSTATVPQEAPRHFASNRTPHNVKNWPSIAGRCCKFRRWQRNTAVISLARRLTRKKRYSGLISATWPQ